MKTILINIFVLLLISCSTPQKQGGPCDYDIYKGLAEITSFTPYVENGKELYDIKLKFENSSLSNKEQLLSELKGIVTDSAFIVRNKMQVGLKYRYTVSEVKDGDCQSPIITFHHDLE